MITPNISEEIYTSATKKAINSTIKTRKENKAYYSNKENVDAARDFIFGGKAANTSRKDTRKGSIGHKNSQYNFNIKEEADRVKKGLRNRREGVKYTLQDNGNKVCICCNDTYTSKDFYGSKREIDGLQSSCKICDNRRRAANRVTKNTKEDSLKSV